LATARAGRYPAAIVSDVSEQRLQQFFQREGDQYRVIKEVRDSVLFASHNLLRDPPFSHVDFVTCRNLLIYLDRELQMQVFGLLRYALNPDGYLFLGAAETADVAYFRTIDKEASDLQDLGVSRARSTASPRDSAFCAGAASRS